MAKRYEYTEVVRVPVKELNEYGANGWYPVGSLKLEPEKTHCARGNVVGCQDARHGYCGCRTSPEGFTGLMMRRVRGQ